METLTNMLTTLILIIVRMVNFWPSLYKTRSLAGAVGAGGAWRSVAKPRTAALLPTAHQRQPWPIVETCLRTANMTTTMRPACWLVGWNCAKRKCRRKCRRKRSHVKIMRYHFIQRIQTKILTTTIRQVWGRDK
jgi:hypothetical protein